MLDFSCDVIILHQEYIFMVPVFRLAYSMVQKWTTHCTDKLEIWHGPTKTNFGASNRNTGMLSRG